jgi:hypothetical protein
MDSQIANEKSWMLGNDQFETVAELVRAGHIVPIESTLLTSRGGFWDAVEQGSQNLRNRRHFHSMFDLRRARKHVTPVPLCVPCLDLERDVLDRKSIMEAAPGISVAPLHDRVG